MSQSVSAVEARQKLGEILNRVALRREEIIIERAGKKIARFNNKIWNPIIPSLPSHEKLPINQQHEDQLDYTKNQIKQSYLFLISHTAHDPQLVEVMKPSALANVQKRYET